MPDPSPVPPEEVTAAAEAIHDRYHEGRPCTAKPMAWHVRDARAALDAAAPAIRSEAVAAERERITAGLPGVIGIFNEMCHHHLWGWANGRDRRSCGRRSGCTDRPQKRILITLSHAKASGGFAVTSAASAIDVVPRAGRARPPRPGIS